jgi:2-dehydropantoate 2-reductase
LRADGLQILSPHGDVTLAPKLLTADEISEPFDAILLTVKAYSLDAALEDLAPAVGASTIILPVLNGMRHMDRLTERFGAKAVIGCVCKVAASVDEEGRIVQLAKFNELAYGEINGQASPRVEALDAFMQGVGFDARQSPAIEREMWEKWALLATLGGVTCLMRGNVGEIATASGGVDFALGFLNEVIAVVNAVGSSPSDAAIAGVKAMVTAKASPQTSSMFRDLQKGGPIEADQIIGDLLARAQSAGIATPLLAAAYAHLSVYQNRLAVA